MRTVESGGAESAVSKGAGADRGEALVGEARAWIGTPYRHGGTARGLGCDCLGLVLGVVRAVDPACVLPQVPLYRPDWAEAGRGERLLDALAAALPLRWSRRPGAGVPPLPRAADLLLLRWRDDRPASHLALASGEGTVLHAHAGACVAEIDWTASQARRLAAIFTLPAILTVTEEP